MAVLDGTAIGVSVARGDINTASSVMFLLGVGEILEDWTHKKSVNDLARSMALNVNKVWLLVDGKEVLTRLENVKPKDKVVVHMGNVIPFDGVVTDGEGSHHFVFEDEGCRIPEGMQQRFENLSEEYSHIYLAIDGILAAVICIEDPLREEATDVVRELKEVGLSKIVMMTGDSEQTAHAIALKVGVDDLFELVSLKKLSNALMDKVYKNYLRIVGLNTGLIILGVGGIIQPTTSAMLHNTSTLVISLDSMKKSFGQIK